ncbi:MAG: energy-coupling factor transporter transmembrane component T [Halobacteriota archaeon]|nr:energy-coupling factor transporter transmembrane component T [Halobacteriota archaeon]
MRAVDYRYKDRDTQVHRLNPLCNLILVFSIVILSLIFKDPLYLLFPFIISLSIVFIAKIIREWASMIKIALWLCLVLVIINLIFRPTMEGVLFSIAMSIRLLSVVSAFAILTFTIHPDDLMSAMIRMGLPYRSVLVTSLSTRFFPTLIDDMEAITDALRSRGLEIDKGGFTEGIKNRMEVAIPLLCNSLDRSVQVAEAMESRAFGSGKRTFYNIRRMDKIDYLISIICLIPLFFGFFLRLHGYGG